MKPGYIFRKKGWKSLVAYALSVFLLVVVAYGVFGYATGSIPYYVVSDRPSSMSPTIDFGGVVVIYKVPFNSLKVGDIIVFHDPLGIPLTIVHRIVRVNLNCSDGSSCLITKGDNNATNPSVDPWNVTEQYYVGKVELIVPYAGYFLPNLWSSEGALAYAPITLIAAAAVLLIFATDPTKKAP